MRKRITLMLFLLLSMTAGYTPTVQADTLLVVDVESQRASYVAYNFISYPPQAYNGKTLVKVDKIKGGYVGWYV